MERNYCIKCTTQTGEPLYWNNLYGWGDVIGAQFFTEEDTQNLNLPVDGEWHEVA